MKGRNKQVVQTLPPLGPTQSNDNQNDGLNDEMPTAEIEQNTQKQVQGRPIDPNMDPKKLKRVMASRHYSQKYRLKQMQYIMQLETEVKALQAEVAITSPRIKYVDRQNTLLRVENGTMKQKLSAYTGELMFKEAQYEELKRERDILKSVYHQQVAAAQAMVPPEAYMANPSAANYPPQFVNMGMNQPQFHASFIDPSLPPQPAGLPQAMIDPNLINNQFVTGPVVNMNPSN